MSITNQMAGVVGQSILGAALPSHIYAGNHYPTFPPEPHVAPPGSIFRIEKIQNGFLVHLAQNGYSPAERHYAENEKAAGELVTASLVRWFIEGK